MTINFLARRGATMEAENHFKNRAMAGDSISKHRRSDTSQKGRGNFLNVL